MSNMSVEPSGIVQQPTPLDADLAGYPNPKALAEGYRASGVEAKKQRERADRLEQMLMERLSNDGSNSRSQGKERQSHAERLQEMGVPVDALNAVIAEQVGQALSPLVNGMQARGQVVADHPDYVQFESDVAGFINSDPDMSARYPRMFAVDPVAAMEYAFLKFGDSRRRTAPPASNGSEGSVDASIPSSRSGDSRRAPDASQELQSAFEQFQRTGNSADAQRYAKLRLRSVVSDDFLNQ